MKKAKFVAALFTVAAILLRPEAAVAGAQRAMRLWCTSVAPALFPFLALLPALTGPEACAVYNAALSKFMRPIFGLPGAAAPAVVVGMIAGSPGGAMAARSVCASGLPAKDARRVAICVSGLSPAYLILGVGQGLYGSTQLGLRLALIQATVQLILLIATRWLHYIEETPAQPLPATQSGSPISVAVESVLAICGYMVFFSSIAAVITSFTGPRTGGALLLLADLPSGLAELSHWSIEGKFLLQGAAIGFGGFCIAAQNLDALRSLGVFPRRYFAARCASASLCACASGLLPLKNFGEIMTFVVPGRSTYAFSLFFAGIFTLPGLLFLASSLFLNKGKSRI